MTFERMLARHVLKAQETLERGRKMLGKKNLLVGRQALTIPTPTSTMDQISALASASDDSCVSYGACACKSFVQQESQEPR